MTEWTTPQLAAVDARDEVEVTSRRADGTLRTWRTIWAVRSDGAAYIRAAHGPDTAWYRWAVASGTGRMRVGGLDFDVTFAPADESVGVAVDRAYDAKYRQRYPSIVGGVVGPALHALTLRVDPA